MNPRSAVALSVLVACGNFAGCAGSKTELADAVEPCVYVAGLETASDVATPATLAGDQPTIAYPEVPLKFGIEGTVELNLVITPEGRADSVFVWRGIEARCDSEAHAALKNATYEPARDADGTPVRSRVRAFVTFERMCSRGD